MLKARCRRNEQVPSDLLCGVVEHSPALTLGVLSLLLRYHVHTRQLDVQNVTNSRMSSDPLVLDYIFRGQFGFSYLIRVEPWGCMTAIIKNYDLNRKTYTTTFPCERVSLVVRHVHSKRGIRVFSSILLRITVEAINITCPS